jgi:hypothetical protein
MVCSDKRKSTHRVSHGHDDATHHARKVHALGAKVEVGDGHVDQNNTGDKIAGLLLHHVNMAAKALILI